MAITATNEALILEDCDRERGFVELRDYNFQLMGSLEFAVDDNELPVQETRLVRSKGPDKVNLPVANLIVESEKISRESGVYFFAVKQSVNHNTSKIIYVGRTGSLQSRLLNYGIHVRKQWSEPRWGFEGDYTNTKVNVELTKALSNSGFITLWFAKAAVLRKKGLRCAVALEKEILGQHSDELPLNEATEQSSTCQCAICTATEVRMIARNRHLSPAQRITLIEEVFKRNDYYLPRPFQGALEARTPCASNERA